MAKKYKFETKPRDSRLMYDMEYLGSHLLRDPNKVVRVINKFGQDSFLNFFTQFGVSTREEGVSGISSEKIAESLIRWRIKDNTIPASKIVGNSQLPVEIKANCPFRISLHDNWVDVDGVFVAEDSDYVFYVHEKFGGVGGGGGYDYSMSFVSNDPEEVLSRKELLDVGRFLNYTGNGKGELSSTSQPFRTDEGNVYDMFNVTQVVRHEIAASGHALSTMTVMNEYENGQMAGQYFLPFDGNLLKKHIKFLGSTLYFQRTNFNPLARKVYTNNSRNARPEVPLTAGIRQQFQFTESVFDYNPYDAPKNIMHLIDAIIASRAEYFRDPYGKYLIVTGMGGSQVLENVKAEKLYSQRVNLQTNVAAGQELPVGHTYGKYYTQFGEFTILNTGYLTKPRGWKSEQVGFQGGSWDKEGFDMYIVPINRYDDGRRSIRIATKAKEGINRGLVIGSLRGMSGMYNSYDGSVNLENVNSQDFARNVLMQDKYSVSSSTDGEVSMALSEMAPVIEDPDSIVWLRAKFPNL